MGYGSNELNVYSLTMDQWTVTKVPPEVTPRAGSTRYVAPQVEFERQTLKPVFHLIGYRLWV
jgi:hypothetical protein